jgi:hypothetical protein
MQDGMSDLGTPLIGLPRRNVDLVQRPDPYTVTETVLILLAGVALVDGLIHLGGALESASQLRFRLGLGLVGAIQMLWAILLLRRPSREVLVLGCAFNLAIIGLLALAVAGGGSYQASPWSPRVGGGVHLLLWCAASLPGAHAGAGAGLASLVETAGQLATVAGAWGVAFSERAPMARALTARAVPALVALLFLSVLYGFGAHAA